MKVYLIAFLAIFSGLNLYAQSGFLRGKVIDDEFGEGLIGATIILESDRSVGTTSDFNGDYSLSLPAGTHTIVFSFVSFATVRISDVNIIAGKVTTLDVRMASEATELETVVVSAQAIKDTEAALLTMQKKSANLMDGMSSQTFKRTGDNNLSLAVNKVTGVSVEGGKYVFVRGLGDRYTKTTLNDMDIPGLDPDRNTIQIDIFPTSTVENIVIYKTFSPNLPGDFTGGMVNIETKDFPTEEFTSAAIGFSVTPGMHFNNNFTTYEGGKTDFLGYDDGTRDLPFTKNIAIPDVTTGNPLIEARTRSLNPTMATTTKKSFMNYNFSFNHGNQVDAKKVTLGYNVVFNYMNNTDYYERVDFGDYLKSTSADNTNLFLNSSRRGSLGEQNVLWTSLLSGAAKIDGHSLTVSFLKAQNGISQASERLASDFDNNSVVNSEDILTYTERSIGSMIVQGKHQVGKNSIEWKNAFTKARIYDPDFRVTSITYFDDESVPYGNLNIGSSEVSRFWRDLNEQNENARIDLTRQIGERSKIKVGALATFKKRDFEVYRVTVNTTQRDSIPFNPDYLFYDENIWTPETGKGTYITANREISNSFDARQSIIAGYAMSELQATEHLRATFGLRTEISKMYYTGTNNTGTRSIQDSLTFDEIDLLPSLNLVYGLRDNMNIRASFNKTLARPSFKEKSNAQIFDPISKRAFIGNLNLQKTTIYNFDLRWEYFFKQEEMVSVSAFYKTFDGHIELVSFDVAPDQLKPRNSGDSRVYGTEFEVRKNMAFASPFLKHFSLGSNVSLIRSEVDLKSVIVSEAGGNEYDLRKANLREGEELKDTRVMAGQAPYIVNAYMNYFNPKSRFQGNLSYTVQGKTLTVIGSGRVPDIYAMPFNALNLNISKEFGKDYHSKISIRVENILNDVRENNFISYRADDASFSVFRPGRQYGFKYTYTF